MIKKVLKSRLFIFISTALFFSGIGVVFAFTVLAPDVGFTPKDTNWAVDDVKEALDSLKTKIDGYQKVEYALFNYTGEAQVEIKDSFVLAYNKIKLLSKTIYSGNSCTLSFKFNDGTNAYTLNLNQEYSLKNLYSQGYRKLSVVSNGWCWVNYQFYN